MLKFYIIKKAAKLSKLK